MSSEWGIFLEDDPDDTQLSFQSFPIPQYDFETCLQSSLPSAHSMKGEVPNRQVLVFDNTSSFLSADDLMPVCLAFGDISKIQQVKKHVYKVSFYKLSSATKMVQEKPVNCSFCRFSTDAPTTAVNEGTIVVFNIDKRQTNEELSQDFSKFGKIIQIRQSKWGGYQRYIEYDDLRSAERAKAEMNQFFYRGHNLLVDFSLPGGFRKSAPGHHSKPVEMHEQKRFSQSRQPK